MNATDARAMVEERWEQDVVPAIEEFIRIPNLSPMFDAEWEAHGHMDRAVDLACRWVASRGVRGLGFEVLRIPGLTPVVLLDLPGTAPGDVLLYGHLDKQPPFDGWEDGLGPFTPVRRGDRLYGRGAGDDGYAIFSIVTAMEVLQAQGLPHPRLVALVECSEESGSRDLPAYMERFGHRLGTPALVVGLDSGCGDYERLWATTSLRGLVSGNLTVRVLAEGVHSGDAGGVVPSSFRILRHLLDRLEDASSGAVRPAELHVAIPEARRAQAAHAASVVGPALHERLPFVPGMRPAEDDLTTLLLARTWRPSLSVTAQSGMPPLEQGGNVLRPFTSVKLSLRIPPTLDAPAASRRVKEILESEPPYGASVRFEGEKASQGWEAAATAPWLEASLSRASRAFFGKEPCAMGEGGSIPFMAMLGARFPGAQFLITGVLGPHANAHGPNEFLHLPMARAVTCCVASVLADAARTPPAA